ncbi:hypothetical protein COOONC_16385, partial [Cooperia oncophora]
MSLSLERRYEWLAKEERIDLSSGYSLYHSGTEERTKRGVGFYVPSSLNQHSDCFFHSERMIELCIKLADRSTLRERKQYFCLKLVLQKRLDDRWTWRNDALGLKKEIDYVLLRSMKGVVDVGVLTSVNTGSDHRMLRCKIRLNPISQPVTHQEDLAPLSDSDLLGIVVSLRFSQSISARKSIQEDSADNNVHIQIFRQAIKSGRLRRGRMQALHARRSLTILKETTSSPPSDPSPSDEPFPDHVSQSVKAVRNFYNALYHSSFGPPTPPSGQINLQVHNNEVQMAMKRSKARSAAGSDGIQSPSLRALSQILALPITHFFNNMIRTKVVPATTIEEKSILPPEQAGFRKHFSTIDHIHTINMITEKCHEFNIELCAVFVDFKKAFDSVELPMIWKALEYFGVEENLIMAIQLLYAHSTAAVRIANQLAEFNLQRGVRQGDSMSPVLFTLVLQYALNLIDWQGKGLKLGNKTLSYLAYADDI